MGQKPFGCHKSAGFYDAGCHINLPRSNENKIVIDFSYHFMDTNGFYAGWEDYTLYITPDLSNDFILRITGKDRNDIKEYLYQTFNYALRLDITVGQS